MSDKNNNRKLKLAAYKDLKKQNKYTYYISVGKNEVEDAGLKLGDKVFMTLEVDE